MAVGVLCVPAVGACFSYTIGGRKLDLDGMAEVREVFETDRSTAHDRTQEMLRLRIAAEITDWLRFDSTTIGINGGPTFQATKAGLYNYNDVFQDVSPSLEFEEAYVDVDLDPVDLRIGKQKIYWGKLDRTQPNDLLNPYRYTDLFMNEQEDYKIGVPAIQLGYAVPPRDWLPEEARLTAVWEPMYVPFRFPEAGERWFPPAAIPPSTFFIPGGTLEGVADDVTVPISFATRNVAPPSDHFLNNSTLGLRASGLEGGVDFAVYYYHGFDIQPAFQLFADAIYADRNVPLLQGVTAEATLEPIYRHIDSWGADAAYTVGPVTVRAEGAFILGRPFSRDLSVLVTDPKTIAPEIENALTQLANGASRVPVVLPPSFAQRNAVEWGVGADYSYDGWFALLQVNQTDVLNNDVDLLISDVETRFLANLRKNLLQDQLRGQFIALYGVESDYTLLLPRLAYAITDHVEARAGYLAIFGRQHSVVGQYKQNDQGFIRLRVSF